MWSVSIKRSLRYSLFALLLVFSPSMVSASPSILETLEPEGTVATPYEFNLSALPVLRAYISTVVSGDLHLARDFGENQFQRNEPGFDTVDDANQEDRQPTIIDRPDRLIIRIPTEDGEVIIEVDRNTGNVYVSYPVNPMFRLRLKLKCDGDICIVEGAGLLGINVCTIEKNPDGSANVSCNLDLPGDGNDINKGGRIYRNGDEICWEDGDTGEVTCDNMREDPYNIYYPYLPELLPFLEFPDDGDDDENDEGKQDFEDMDGEGTTPTGTGSVPLNGGLNNR